MPGRGSTPFSRGRGGWTAILLAVLLAFSWQSFLTQTHQHFAATSLAPAADAAPGGAQQQHDRKSSSALPDNCWLCREVAHSGHVLLPQVLDFDAPAPAGFWLATLLSTGLVLAARSHAWRSRAPPSPLQA